MAKDHISGTSEAERSSPQSEAGCALELNGCKSFRCEQYLFISSKFFFLLLIFRNAWAVSLGKTEQNARAW